MDLLKIKKTADKRLTNVNIKGRVVYLININVQKKRRGEFRALAYFKSEYFHCYKFAYEAFFCVDI